MYKNKVLVLFALILLSIPSIIDGNRIPKGDDKPFPVEGPSGGRLIDVIVLNDDSEHIFGLQTNSFKLYVNGNEQKILSVKEINVLETKGFQSPVPSQPVWNLTPDEQVSYIFLIANVPADKRLYGRFYDGLLEFVTEKQVLNSLTAVYIISTDEVRKIADFTTNWDELENVLNATLSLKDLPAEFSFFYEGTQFALLKNLTQFVQALQGVKGKKNIIMMSAGIPDTLGLDHYETNARGSVDTAIRAIDQAGYEAHQRKKLAELITDLRVKLLTSNTCLDFIDLAKTIKPRGAGISAADRQSEAQSLTNSLLANRAQNDYGVYSDRFTAGITMQVDDENRLRIPRDITGTSGGVLFQRALSSKGKFYDNLEQIFYMTSHYYLIEYQLSGAKPDEHGLMDVKIEVNSPEVDRLMYNPNTCTEIK